jgi:hypothetical protein
MKEKSAYGFRFVVCLLLDERCSHICNNNFFCAAWWVIKEKHFKQ